MPRQKVQLINNEIYHVVLRSVGDTEVFRDESDHYRGIFSIYEFNNDVPIEIWRRRRDRIQEKRIDKIVGSPTPHNLMDKRKKLVEVLAFSLMPNHIHLLVRQIKDNGISKFMRKVGGGYANFFNKKYNRKGHLFNQFKAIHITSDKQLLAVFVYIHANRISLIEPGWKERGVKNPKEVIEFLEKDKWHSYPDYVGGKNFPSVTNRVFLLEAMDGIDGCRQAIENWVEYKKEPQNFIDIILE